MAESKSISWPVLDLKQRGFEDWDRYIMVVPETLQTLNLCNKTLQTVEQEAYIVLRELFCIAGGDIRSHPRLSPRDFIISSTQMALCLYSIIFGVPIAKPKPFGTCDLWRLQRNLSRSTVFVHGSNMGRMMISTIPILGAWVAHLAKSLPVGLEGATWNSELALRNQFPRCMLVDLEQFTSVIYLRMVEYH